ncbi:glycoside hydrolase family 16 protein [Zasmidium cellare ATCC 36951]|uniref:Glycoside hydrolase family 16 protein n=1 Tax=Zasmidium cellare ATCC 36951 TaxID=1080233 RepID=A0A6A6CG32_ZASCE|nr:glycoside hydrolase family 16 protein [Zasmidium cellare ATCC 36951]KAF2165170.1 glycoside hydrolase family 16 protein [Zasmidium cellare ATCC 36951]
MHILTVALSACLLAATASAQRADGQFWPCNPIKNDTGACPPDPGLPTSTYSVDFTKQTSIPTNWTISNYANIPFGPLGAEFTYAKRYDAPQLWTDFFILFGKITIEARIANGTGMISSFVLISDDFDEIDFEFSGNNFGDTASRGKGQNNYFGKGITGNYDRGGWFDVVDPQGTFHTYEIEWTEERLVWRVDGVEVRRFLARDATTAKGSAYQFPQTPSKFQLGIWAGGDPGQNEGTKAWAGGETNISAAPYTMYVKNVKIENYKPAWAYNWTDQSGTWQSIQLLKQPVVEEDADEGNSTITPPSMEMNSTDPENDGLEGGIGGSSSATLPLTSSLSSSTSTDFHYLHDDQTELFLKHDEVGVFDHETDRCFFKLKASLFIDAQDQQYQATVKLNHKAF